MTAEVAVSPNGLQSDSLGEAQRAIWAHERYRTVTELSKPLCRNGFRPRGLPNMKPGSVSTGLYIKAAPGLKLRDRRVTRLAVKVRAILPWLEPSDTPTVRAWGEIEYLCNQVYAALRAYGATNARGGARKLLDDYRKLRQTQVVFARELGMTPLARQTLKASSTDAALDLAAMAVEYKETDDAVPVGDEEAASDGNGSR